MYNDISNGATMNINTWINLVGGVYNVFVSSQFT